VRFCGTGWANTEFRSYTFSQSYLSEAHLIETPDSKKLRKSGDAKPLDREEQAQLKRTTQMDWQDQGYVDEEKAQATMKAKV